MDFATWILFVWVMVGPGNAQLQVAEFESFESCDKTYRVARATQAVVATSQCLSVKGLPVLSIEPPKEKT